MSDRSIEQEHEMLMLGLIHMLGENAWTFLGKRVNPGSDKEEVVLPAARAMIDTLGALKERTEGRLTERERSMLESLLTNLRLNYLEEMKAEANKPKEASASSEPSS